MNEVRSKPLPDAALCEMLLHQSPGCAWLLKRDGMFQAVYGDAAPVFGRPATEFGALNFIHLCGPSARRSWAARLECVFAGQTIRAAAQFGEAAHIFAITMFPIRRFKGEIAFAAGMAHPLPQAGMVLRTLAALEASRARMAELLHDHIGQSLSAAGLQFDLLRMDLADSALPIPQRIGEIQAVLETIVTLVRDANRELNPATAERVGLRAALDRLAGCLRADFSGNVRVFTDARAQPPPEAAAALYRIAQEATAQAVRRPGCSAIGILLKSLRNGPMLEIHDNGVDGADKCPEAAGLELMVMQYFADRAGIELQISSAPDNGTVVHALYRSPILRAPGPRIETEEGPRSDGKRGRRKKSPDPQTVEVGK